MATDYDKLLLERDALKVEIDRLQQELQLSAKEKRQSAEYGLHLLEEKEKLVARLNELESAHDATKTELEAIHNAFSKFQTNLRESTDQGITQEECLLMESATKEALFTSTLQELERELKSVRSELALAEAVKETLLNEHTEQLKISDWERKSLRREVKELKEGEVRLSIELNELEDENNGLKKTVSCLKSSLVDYEKTKQRSKRLQEENELRKLEVEEFETLKNIAEKQLNEALEALESEIEKNSELKKKLDEVLTNDPMIYMNNLGSEYLNLYEDENLVRSLTEFGENYEKWFKPDEATPSSSEYSGRQSNQSTSDTCADNESINTQVCEEDASSKISNDSACNAQNDSITASCDQMQATSPKSIKRKRKRTSRSLIIFFTITVFLTLMFTTMLANMRPMSYHIQKTYTPHRSPPN